MGGGGNDFISHEGHYTSQDKRVTFITQTVYLFHTEFSVPFFPHRRDGMSLWKGVHNSEGVGRFEQEKSRRIFQNENAFCSDFSFYLESAKNICNENFFFWLPFFKKSC